MLNFGITTANAKLFADFFIIHLNMTLPMVIALSVPCHIVICYVIGHYDEKSGFWQIENNLNYRVTPYPDEMLAGIQRDKKAVL